MFRQGGGKYNRKIIEWSHAMADGIFIFVHDHRRLVLYQVPFIDHHNQTFVVPLYQLEYVQVLGFYATLRIQHQNADIGVLNGPDGTHDGIIFQIFRHLVFTADTGRIYQIEIKPELGITGINGIPGGSGDIGHDITFFSDKRVD